MFFRASRSNIPTLEPPLVSVLVNKSSSNLKALLTSPSVVPHTAEQRRWGVKEMATTATGPDPRIKRFRLFYTSVHGVHKKM